MAFHHHSTLSEHKFLSNLYSFTYKLISQEEYNPQDFYAEFKCLSRNIFSLIQIHPLPPNNPLNLQAIYELLLMRRI